MKKYQELTREELLSLREQLSREYEDAKGKGLKLNMSRGKPGVSQLKLSMPMLDVINSQSDMKTVLGNDT